MSDSAINVDRVLDLAGVICDEGASDSEFAETDACLLIDQRSRDDYLNYCWMHVALTMESRIHRAVQQVHQQINTGLVVPAIPVASDLDAVKVAAPVSAAPTFPATLFNSTVGFFSSDWPSAYLVATVIFGIGLLIGSHVYMSEPEQIVRQSVPLPSPLSPLPSVVGRITGMADCKWRDPKTAPANNDAVSLGRKYALASGLMELTYDTGAKVILQGPVTYEVESKDSGFLSLGKLTARVDKRGSGFDGHGSQISKTQDPRPKTQVPSPNPLFAVHTPTATITDLGTEFGVEVSREGHTVSHVFRGSVRLQVLSTDGSDNPVAQVLHENESAHVEGGGTDRIKVLGNSGQDANFVREIPKQTVKVFDLVDVVAGGDGFSGRRNRGIDATNGQVIGWAVSQLGHFPAGDGRYHRVEAMPFVDGVFIPDGRSGPVKLDSARHTFGEFVNSTNLAGRYIWAGGKTTSNDPTLSPKVETRLGDVDYASASHGYLYLTSNNGITFDLGAIRQANPGCKLLRFCATAGNTETDSRDGGSAVFADLFVFVDGQVRFQRREINGCSGVFHISIPLGDSDRYLTLTSLDAGNGIKDDDILFGDPRLELLSDVPQHGPDLQPK